MPEFTGGGRGLAGRPVIITGAGRGLGRGYAHYLAGRGALLVVNDVDESAETARDEILAAGGRAVAEVGSVSEWDAAERLVQRAVDEYGSLYGLVANAGVFHVGPALDESPESMRRTVEANLIGTLFTGIAALRYLVPAGAGSVITTTSASALGLAGVATYSATKGAIASLTYSWAAEVAASGVRVNCIRPRGFTRMSAARGVDPSDAGEADAVAPAVAYLLDERSAALNGQVLGFDGATLQLIDRARSHELGTRSDWSIDTIADAISRTGADTPRSSG
jgi:NAD(P)-dependent dehydrogenase (short-subunit alcohol dehydrogenase family)